MSYKVIIVDDNQYILDSLAQTINWADADCVVIGVANDSDTGLSLIMEQRPDIIISDIKMPGMDGLEMIGKVRRENFETKVIFITGFSDFSYAQQALRLGAFDIVIKPIENVMLTAIINRAVDQLDHEHMLRQSLSNKTDLIGMSALKGKLISDISCGLIRDREEIIRKGREIGLRFVCYSVLLLSAKENHNQFASLFYQLIQKLPRNDRQELVFSNYNGYPLVVFFHKQQTSQTVIKTNVIDFHRWFHANMRSYAFDFMGSAVYQLSDVDQLIKSCEHAMMIMQGTSYDAYDHDVIFTKLAEDSTHQVVEEDIVEKIDSYSKAFCRVLGNYHSMQEITEQMLTFIKDACGYQLSLVKSVSLQSCAFIIRDIIEKTGSKLKISDISNRIANVKHIDELDDILREFSDEIYRVCQVDMAKCSKNVRRAVSYIQTHAAGDMSLGSLSEFLGVSSAYLSGQIKKETGKNFVDLVNQRRVEIARELMMDSNLNLDEVSSRCGFQDYSYFYHVFKKFTGKSPKAYKNQGMQ